MQAISRNATRGIPLLGTQVVPTIDYGCVLNVKHIIRIRSAVELLTVYGPLRIVDVVI